MITNPYRSIAKSWGELGYHAVWEINFYYLIMIIIIIIDSNIWRL